MNAATLMTSPERRKAREELRLIRAAVSGLAQSSRERSRLEARAGAILHALMADAQAKKAQRSAS